MRRGWKRAAIARTVVVNLKTGTTIRGSLLEERGALMILGRAELLAEDGKALPSPLALDGETIIDSDNVDFAQVLGT